MKKTLLLAGIAGVLFAHNAQAENTLDIKPVIGIDYVYSQIDMDDGVNEIWEDKLNAYALSAGVKINKYFGVEAFYQQSEEAEKSHDIYVYPYHQLSIDTTIKYKAYGIDLVGYAPVHKNFDLIGTIGTAYYDTDISLGYMSASEGKLGFRLGAGAQVNINEHVSLRIMGKYNYTNIEGAKNMFDVTAGARFYF